jgi:hypothetical protein
MNIFKVKNIVLLKYYSNNNNTRLDVCIKAIKKDNNTCTLEYIKNTEFLFF